MPNNTARTIVIFGLIALILGGAAVGGVLLMKARNNSYAAARTTQATTNAPAAPQNEQKPEDKKQPDPQPQPQKPEPAKTDTTAPTTPQPQPVAPQNNQVAKTDPGVTPSTGSMPATGPEDFFATVGMLMLAVFFGAKLLRSRADYRRYIGS